MLSAGCKFVAMFTCVWQVLAWGVIAADPEVKAAAKGDGATKESAAKDKAAQNAQAIENQPLADQPAADPQVIAQLIQQLGAEPFVRREEAARRILELGIAALPLVEEGTSHGDLEIRYRCNDLKIKLVRADLRRRLEEFAADTKGERNIDLPLWKRFAEITGDTPTARSLFVDIYRSDPELLLRLELESGLVGDWLAGKAMALQVRMQGGRVKFAEVACLLYLAGEDGIRSSEQVSNMILAGCYQQTFQDAMTNQQTREHMKKILARFIVRCEGWSAPQALNVASLYQMPEGIALARKLVKNPAHGHMLMQALPYLARFGDREDLPIFEGLLENRTVLVNMQINETRIQTQVRDCALAGALLLLAKEPSRLEGTLFADRNLKKFGFSRLENAGEAVFSAHGAGFTDDKERDAVFAKWGELKKQLQAKSPQE